MQYPILGSLRAFGSDRKGNFAITSALIMIVVMGVAALGVDVGSVFADRRKAQGTTDIAALVAAGNLSNASAAVTATLTQNKFNSTASPVVQLGIYAANSAIPASQRFTPSAASSANAARVTLQTATPLFFGQVLTRTGSFSIQTTATATSTAFATFSIGSTLVSVNGGLLNQILGQMLGTQLSLSAMDYQSLLSANIDVFSFMNALATRLNVTGVSYTSLLSGNAQLGTIINATIDSEHAASATSSVVYALSEIASSLNTTTTKMPLNTLLSPGAYGNLMIGQTPNSTVTVSLFSLLSAVAGLANGTNQVAAALNVGVPGILSASMLLAIGQPPVGTSWVTVGSIGASVYTVQTRLLLTVQILGNALIPSVTLPIYVSAASGLATLNSLQCGYPDISTSSVVLGVTPGVVDAWIGNVNASQFKNFSQAPQPGPATLVSAPALTVTGLAHVTMANTSPTPVTFSYSDIQSQTGQTVSTTSYLSSLTSQLLSNLSINVSVAGLGVSLPSGVLQSLNSIISPETASLDQILATIFAAAGVSIGQATVWVNGIRCDGAVLVN